MKKIDELRQVMEGREEGYGASNDTLSRIAVMWSAYLTIRSEIEFQLDAATVAEMMVVMKLARSAGQLTDSARDDRLDTAGYALLSAEALDGDTAGASVASMGFQIGVEE